MKKLLAMFLSLAMVLSMTGCMITIDGETTTTQTNTEAKGTIGLSVSTQNNPFFVTLVDGAQAQADKLGVTLSVADAGDDVTKQTSDIEDLVATGISVLIVNPVDSDAVASAVEAKIFPALKLRAFLSIYFVGFLSSSKPISKFKSLILKIFLPKKSPIDLSE